VYRLICCDIRIYVRRIFLGQQINTITDKTLELRADLVFHTVLNPKEEPTDRLNKEKQL